MTNIIEAVSRMLTPEIVGKLATASGLDASIGQKAMGAVVPSILAGLVEAVQKPGGARSLAKAVSDQPADDTVRDDTVSDDTINDDTINIEQAESSSDESAADQPPHSEGRPTDDGHREGQEANGEARYRRGSGVAR